MLPSAFFSDLTQWSNRHLIWQFARREILARYHGSMLGLGWSLLGPLLMLAVYTLVFRDIFKARWPSSITDNSGFEFALQVYAGLIVFNLFAECVGRAPKLILEQPNLVKKVVFPLESLAWVAVIAALFNALINLGVLVGASLWLRGWHTEMLCAPLILLPLIPLLLGLSWGLAGLGVFVRDIAPAISLTISLLMFLSPIFYPASALGERWQFLMSWNPLSLIIESLRQLLFSGQWPNGLELILYSGITIGMASIGLLCFRFCREGFADVL